jgi:SIT family siderophore-iron:H+ symporter-like MFS transporter
MTEQVLGRKEAYMTSIAFYVVGYIIVASSQSIYSYGVGNSIYIIGITGTFRVLPNRFHHTHTIHTMMLGLFLLQAIIIADISSLRNRLFWSIFPSIPGTSSSSVDSLHRSDLNAYLYQTLGTINVWLAGTVASKFLLANNSAPNNWRWGYGMSASELRHWINSFFSLF